MFARSIAASATSAAAVLLFAMTLTGCATAPSSGPISIASQGSFFVGGRQVTAAGAFDPTLAPNPPTAGQTYWVDQMYVQYQIPPNARKLPLIFVHGGSGTGRVWETTPDGREGYQTLFLRRGYPVYIVDFPRQGRAGYPTFVSYEPGFVFNQLDMPKPIPLYKGAQNAGTAVSELEFAALAKIPLQVVYGDNIPANPIPDLVADGRRAQVITSKLFVDALNRKGGKASVLHLPDVGLRGNSHFMFSDLNNVGVADQLPTFLQLHGLDTR